MALCRPCSSRGVMRLSKADKLKMSNGPSVRKIRTEVSEGSGLTFFSREHLFSFIKPELTYVYGLYSCLDLDGEYLGRISRSTRKIDAKQYVGEMSKYLVKNCNQEVRVQID